MAKLNPKTDKPEKLIQITKGYMKGYILYQANTEENKAWFKAMVKNPDFQKSVKNNLTGKETIDIDIKKVRKEFCKKFFPQLVEKEPKKTFIDSIDDEF